MMNKYLERRIELNLEEGAQSNSKIQIEYFLVESEPDQIYGYFFDKIYGIEISKREIDNYAESEIVKNLYNSKEEALRILEVLAENTVTPMGLSFVLDDIMAL